MATSGGKDKKREAYLRKIDSKFWCPICEHDKSLHEFIDDLVDGEIVKKVQCTQCDCHWNAAKVTRMTEQKINRLNPKYNQWI